MKRVACLSQWEARVGSLVAIRIPYDALSVSGDDTICGAHRVGITVGTYCCDSEGGGCDGEAGKVPSECDVFTGGHFVEGSGLDGWHG